MIIAQIISFLIIEIDYIFVKYIEHCTVWYSTIDLTFK
nr:MAG TPA: hypothetical protein [Myoviridae sp. ctNPX13]